jgi:hypothetical protein
MFILVHVIVFIAVCDSIAEITKKDNRASAWYRDVDGRSPEPEN